MYLEISKSEGRRSQIEFDGDVVLAQRENWQYSAMGDCWCVQYSADCQKEEIIDEVDGG